jgi:hypothetical protein
MAQNNRQRSFMPHPNTRSRTPAAAAVVILLLACVGLAACGGSSSTTSTSANAASTGSTSTGSASTGTSTTGPSASTPGVERGRARFSAIRECLEKNGIALPTRTPGSGRPASASGGFLGRGAGAGGPQLPKGVTRAQYEAALKKCGGHVFTGGGARFTNNPVLKAAFAKYAECLRQNGVNLPAPNTSGNGPVFDTKGIDTASPQFKTATMKCRGTLVGAFRRPGGSGGPTPGGPPSGSASSG